MNSVAKYSKAGEPGTVFSATLERGLEQAIASSSPTAFDQSKCMSGPERGTLLTGPGVDQFVGHKPIDRAGIRMAT